MQDDFGEPGTHWAVPFATEIKVVTVRPNTDTLQSIQTISRDGIKNRFEDVQVISHVDRSHLIPMIRQFGINFRRPLVFDRIKEELRNFCANHTIDEIYNTMFLDIVHVVKRNVKKKIEELIGNNSITIQNLAIPKPNIPDRIVKNYEQVKVQWTERLVAKQRQEAEKVKKETESIKAVLDAEREKKVLQIELEKDLLEKAGEKNLSSLSNAIIKEREENKANVESYKKSKNAEANKKLYSKDYVRLEMAKALSQNTKFFFSGESSPLGALLTKIMGEKK